MFRRQQSESPPLIDGKVPVFVFPTSLTFYSDDQASHKQILTLYNPYDFPLKFKVLCTAPKKYSVVDSEGSIKTRCCVDIVVRHKEIGINNEGIRDKFRIQVSEHGQKSVIGRKDITSILLPTKDKAPATEESFEAITTPPGLRRSDSQTSMSSRSMRTYSPGGSTSGPSWIIIVAAVVCIVALMLPMEGDTSSLPSYLTLSLNQKLIAAYILGLVTMTVLRS